MNQSELILASIARQESIISTAEKEIEKLKGKLAEANELNTKLHEQFVKSNNEWWDKLIQEREYSKHLKEELKKALPKLPQFPWTVKGDVEWNYKVQNKVSTVQIHPANFHLMSIVQFSQLTALGAELVAEEFVQQAMPLLKAQIKNVLEEQCVSVST